MNNKWMTQALDLAYHYLKCIQIHSLFIVILLMGQSVIFGATSQKIHFWRTPQKGANIFNQTINAEDIKAAKKYGIKFIRLAPDKFISFYRDFLIGNADDYGGLIKKDLEKLKNILDMCYAEKMPVVITMLSLPGSRWK